MGTTSGSGTTRRTELYHALTPIPLLSRTRARPNATRDSRSPSRQTCGQTCTADRQPLLNCSNRCSFAHPASYFLLSTTLFTLPRQIYYRFTNIGPLHPTGTPTVTRKSKTYQGGAHTGSLGLPKDPTPKWQLRSCDAQVSVSQPLSPPLLPPPNGQDYYSLSVSPAGV